MVQFFGICSGLPSLEEPFPSQFPAPLRSYDASRGCPLRQIRDGPPEAKYRRLNLQQFPHPEGRLPASAPNPKCPSENAAIYRAVTSVGAQSSDTPHNRGPSAPPFPAPARLPNPTGTPGSPHSNAPLTSGANAIATSHPASNHNPTRGTTHVPNAQGGPGPPVGWRPWQQRTYQQPPKAAPNSLLPARPGKPPAVTGSDCGMAPGVQAGNCLQEYMTLRAGQRQQRMQQQQQHVLPTSGALVYPADVILTKFQVSMVCMQGAPRRTSVWCEIIASEPLALLTIPATFHRRMSSQCRLQPGMEHKEKEECRFKRPKCLCRALLGQKYHQNSRKHTGRLRCSRCMVRVVASVCILCLLPQTVKAICLSITPVTPFVLQVQALLQANSLLQCPHWMPYHRIFALLVYHILHTKPSGNIIWLSSHPESLVLAQEFIAGYLRDACHQIIETTHQILVTSKRLLFGIPDTVIAKAREHSAYFSNTCLLVSPFWTVFVLCCVAVRCAALCCVALRCVLLCCVVLQEPTTQRHMNA